MKEIKKRKLVDIIQPLLIDDEFIVTLEKLTQAPQGMEVLYPWELYCKLSL